MPRPALWWYCHDGAMIRLESIMIASRYNSAPEDRAGTTRAISFELYGSRGYLDRYPTEAEREAAYAQLMTLLPPAGPWTVQ